eukprot:TRINITY_DN120249_c0_g1_i1.p4 TRINITY_DN120249_c0_g1~~TRINITY_DN120249_c0_g1_i1.p4  ORF type:complete len:115 (-),score=4.99 TRINITY_DN120249_c0_g1_i1:252-596(-)
MYPRWLHHDNGQDDNVEYKELVARCIALKLTYGQLNKLELNVMNAWSSAYKDLYCPPQHRCEQEEAVQEPRGQTQPQALHSKSDDPLRRYSFLLRAPRNPQAEPQGRYYVDDAE